ncbi:hypothetical protein GTY65_21005 [Streptomyces sp. SID8379]|uniref:hypothetical protein n=1 Tax=unclassified Streptomyces TaxID=2593676 RepID=UPI00037BCF66|nr:MULTISPECIES: hypothetical protein [unclassified Streptomyces]MYW66519.1 hypothetical protein [Streptomyces sp. SID8379]
MAPPATNPDTELALVSTWDVGGPDGQRAVLDAIERAWRTRPWPHTGLLSYGVDEGADGTTLMHRSRWRDLAAYEDFFHGAGDSDGNGRDDRNAEIDAAVPGIRRLGLHKTRLLHSSWGLARGRAPRVVTVTVGEREPAPVEGPGLIAVHLHRTLDGSAYLARAAWESGRDAVEGDRYRPALRLTPADL